ncbi:hypothetical protein JTE90_019190 [Oedothorax gibbosus]|uniref:Uncharacterized protein n=1 Tax=Oedothorax gibbosus TaxID=931172 RepID=A0AAV6U7K3_9ARAC|nr:hypothetical protein JTE90_019190 [Oedothorax gibbosus]
MTQGITRNPYTSGFGVIQWGKLVCPTARPNCPGKCPKLCVGVLRERHCPPPLIPVLFAEDNCYLPRRKEMMSWNKWIGCPSLTRVGSLRVGCCRRITNGRTHTFRICVSCKVFGKSERNRKDKWKRGRRDSYSRHSRKPAYTKPINPATMTTFTTGDQATIHNYKTQETGQQFPKKGPATEMNQGPIGKSRALANYLVRVAL